MKSYYTYIIECTDGLLYTAFTNNITRRFEEHQLGKTNQASPISEDHLNYFIT
ncbi:GIY-YIG nuclease family protein [Marinirhabdus gelatinilytica]|uniref:GIY-YIG nuclease family protein n=1 Tax=Marinirhabdus gelatinilytica TaxID=1703343 RepID=UPI002936EDFF|nr:GIY-YIG nuclease family protein [Marinirhabdus gelatinilytica]